MPAAPTWYPRIPAAIATLRETPATAIWVGRDDIETLLGIRSRRAQQLMRTMSTFRVGKGCLLVTKEDLLQWLESTHTGAKAEIEHRRRERVEDTLLALHRDLQGRKREIYTPAQAPAIRAAGLAELPDTTVLRPGELQIQFTNIEDLMRQLFRLSQVLMNDYIAIERTLSP